METPGDAERDYLAVGLSNLSLQLNREVAFVEPAFSDNGILASWVHGSVDAALRVDADVEQDLRRLAPLSSDHRHPHITKGRFSIRTTR